MDRRNTVTKYKEVIALLSEKGYDGTFSVVSHHDSEMVIKYAIGQDRRTVVNHIRNMIALKYLQGQGGPLPSETTTILKEDTKTGRIWPRKYSTDMTGLFNSYVYGERGLEVLMSHQETLNPTYVPPDPPL